MKTKAKIICGLGILSLMGHLNFASAYLGGFETEDGYQSFLHEVQTYNAGQYGANNGGPGGGPTTITPGTGLWKNLSGISYPTFSSLGSTSYATGHEYYDRLDPGNVAKHGLVITTNSEGWSGPTLQYQYSLDSRDLNGTNPNTTAGKVINFSFWWCPRIYGSGEGGGIGPGTVGDTIDLVDSSGNVGFTMGLLQPGTTTDYVGV